MSVAQGADYVALAQTTVCPKCFARPRRHCSGVSGKRQAIHPARFIKAALELWARTEGTPE